MKLAIAGCGRISQVGYAAAIRDLPGAEVCALADPDRARRERLAAATDDPPTFDTVAELLEEAEPDAIVIASPPDHHVEQAQLAAAAGVPALVEKPPGRDADEAEKLAALDPPVHVGFNRRFSHLTAIAPRVPTDGELRVTMRLTYRRASWRAHEVREDALGDLGPHLADLAACLLGGELRAARASSVAPQRARVELIGPRGSARLVCGTDSAWMERVEVRRPSGELSARSVHGGAARAAFARLRRGDHPLVGSLAGQLRAFDDSLRGEDGNGLATAHDGIVAMKALDAARESARRGNAEVAL